MTQSMNEFVMKLKVEFDRPIPTIVRNLSKLWKDSKSSIFFKQFNFQKPKYTLNRKSIIFENSTITTKSRTLICYKLKPNLKFGFKTTSGKNLLFY